MAIALLLGSHQAVARSFVKKAVVSIAAVTLATSAARAYQANHTQNQQESSTQASRPSGTDGAQACTRQLPMGRAPSFTNPKMAIGFQTICYEEFTLGYSGQLRAALWSAEYLTEDRVRKARTLKRVNTFHEDLSLPPEARAHLKDWVRSGLDRGHLAPNGDMSNKNAQNESFSLANMVAQDSHNNRHTWEGIETGARNYAVKHGGVYVISGPLFNGARISFLRDRVAIPTQLFKLLYDPVRKMGGVYMVDNAQTTDITWTSIAQFEQTSGYRFNIGNPPLLAMPKPKEHF